jgi:hypothetical protein
MPLKYTLYDIWFTRYIQHTGRYRDSTLIVLTLLPRTTPAAKIFAVAAINSASENGFEKS